MQKFIGEFNMTSSNCERLFFSLYSLFEIMEESHEVSSLVKNNKESICIKLHKSRKQKKSSKFKPLPNVIKNENDLLFVNNLITNKIIDSEIVCRYASYNYYEFDIATPEEKRKLYVIGFRQKIARLVDQYKRSTKTN